MAPRRVLVATRNAGKLGELRPMLAAAGFDPIDLTSAGIVEEPEEELVESHETFEANALAKARYFAERWAEGPVLADDSGLVVDALAGAPGVYSRRWAARAGEVVGEGGADAANNARLMRELAGEVRRGASFVCAAAWVDGEREFVELGRAYGEILQEPRGAGGFGYDAYFMSTELGRSFGEASLEDKERVSHRGRAVAALLAVVAARQAAEEGESGGLPTAEDGRCNEGGRGD